MVLEQSFRRKETQLCSSPPTNTDVLRPFLSPRGKSVIPFDEIHLCGTQGSEPRRFIFKPLH